MKQLSIVAGVIGLIAPVIAPWALAAGPYIYVANAGEDTVSKIDVSNNTEVARYATWINAGTNNRIASHLGNSHSGPAPSRIVQDSLGYVYVLNRFFSSASYYYGGTNSPNPPHRPVLVKIAPSGSGPTSTNSTALPITDINNSNDIESGEAQDVRIVWAKPVGVVGVDEVTLGRALAIDGSGALWVGMYGNVTTTNGFPPLPNTAHYYKYDSNGNLLAGPVDTGTKHTPYGAQVDINGKLWSVDERTTLAEIDTSSNTLVTILDHSNFAGVDYGKNYSLAISNDCSFSPPRVKVYLSESKFGRTYIVYDPQTNTFSNASASVPQFVSYSVAVDSKGNVLSGALTTGQIVKVSPSGTLIWNTGAPASGSPQFISNLHGLIVDKNDDVWAVDLGDGQSGHSPGNRVLKYQGGGSTGGTFLGAVKVGDSPYTYGNPPPPTCAGASPTPTPTPSPSPTPTPTATPGCATVVNKEIRCLPNGTYSYTFSVTNNSGNAASQILLTPVQGSTFTLTPQLTNLSSPLQNGQSTTIATTIGNAKPGDRACFFVSLMSEKTQCCIVEVCVTLPPCGEVSPTSTIIMETPAPATRQLPRGKRRP